MKIRSAIIVAVVFCAGLETGRFLPLHDSGSFLAAPAAAATIGPLKPRQQQAICPPPGSTASPAFHNDSGTGVVKYECTWVNMIKFLCPPGFQFAEGPGDFSFFGGGAANITGMFWHCTQIKVARK